MATSTVWMRVGASKRSTRDNKGPALDKQEEGTVNKAPVAVALRRKQQNRALHSIGQATGTLCV